MEGRRSLEYLALSNHAIECVRTEPSVPCTSVTDLAAVEVKQNTPSAYRNNESIDGQLQK